MMHRQIAAIAAFALTVLTGHVTDQTTGQPLTNVQVTFVGLNVSAKTDRDGRFVVRNMPAGRRMVILSSNDVPSQTRTLFVTGARQNVNLHACSTTLDFKCASPNAPGGGSGGGVYSGGR